MAEDKDRRAILTLGSAEFAVSVPPPAIASAVAARSAAHKSPYVAFIKFFGTGVFKPFDADMFAPLTQNGCRLFCGAGAGYDTVDTQWLASQGAYYCNTSRAIAVSTANGALMLILAATRAASQADMSLLPLGQDIEGMTLGIIGFGAIGKALAVRAQACGMKIIYYSRRRAPESEENGAIYVSMDDLFATSDVISVNCPLTPETRHLIGPAAFSKMKTGVFIVNTARGSIIDEDALVEALQSGKVSRVGLDVFANEPHIHPGLLDPSLAYRVTMQPHMAGRTVQSFVKGELELFKSLEEFMRGERPEYAVNDPEV
ncbi:putative 2-hydroxyacid dehydrogenase [Mycena olivaceomarginata]|nr:putative 2-hydroxyacid dehydrogenase [Mycena olivaceomarginata]